MMAPERLVITDGMQVKGLSGVGHVVQHPVGRQVVVATLPRWSTSLMPSEDGLAQLTEAEREQLEAFLAQRRADAEESNSRYTAMSAASSTFT